jgi:hypothetical protein
MFILDYLFYRIFSFSKLCKMDDPIFFAIPALTINISFNIETVRRALGYRQILDNPYPIILYLSILVVLYLVYDRFKRYIKINDRYKNETKKKKIIGYIIVSIYLIVTIVAFVYFFPDRTHNKSLWIF